MNDTPKWIQNRIKYNNNYNKENYKQLGFRVRKDYYNEILAPIVQASGESLNSYIKKAVDQRIERESIPKRISAEK